MSDWSEERGVKKANITNTIARVIVNMLSVYFLPVLIWDELKFSISD